MVIRNINIPYLNVYAFCWRHRAASLPGLHPAPGLLTSPGAHLVRVRGQPHVSCYSLINHPRLWRDIETPLPREVRAGGLWRWLAAEQLAARPLVTQPRDICLRDPITRCLAVKQCHEIVAVTPAPSKCELSASSRGRFIMPSLYTRGRARS